MKKSKIFTIIAVVGLLLAGAFVLAYGIAIVSLLYFLFKLMIMGM